MDEQELGSLAAKNLCEKFKPLLKHCFSGVWITLGASTPLLYIFTPSNIIGASSMNACEAGHLF